MGRLLLIALLFAGLSSIFAVGDAPWRAQLADAPLGVDEPSVPLDDDRHSDPSDDLEMSEPDAARSRVEAVIAPPIDEAQFARHALLIPESRVPPVPVPPPIA